MTEEETPGGLFAGEALASDAIGRLIEFWGFKRNMGRLWTVLYLAAEPLSAKALQERLGLSSGAVSMTTTELQRWGVVKKVWVQGERRDFFVAEGNFWKMISRVFEERERAQILAALDALEDALADLRLRAESDAEHTGHDRPNTQGDGRKHLTHTRITSAVYLAQNSVESKAL